MTKKQSFIAVILSLIGLSVWVIIAELSNVVEPWDSNSYFLIGLPIMFISSALAGYIEPNRPVIWGISIVILQPIALFFQSEGGPLAVVGLIFFLFFTVLTTSFASLGKKIRKSRTK